MLAREARHAGTPVQSRLRMKQKSRAMPRVDQWRSIGSEAVVGVLVALMP